MADVATDQAVPEAVRPAPRDWARAAVWIGGIVLAIVAGWLLVLTAACGCTTVAA